MPSPPYRLTEAAPGAEPLTLEEAKTHLRVDGAGDDALIAGLIVSARQACESFTGRALISRACSLWLDAWPECGAAVDIPRAPLLSVSGINLYDEEDTPAALSPECYYADIPGGRVALKMGAPPPLPCRRFGSIEIQFRAGYGSAPQNVPAALRQGMKQLVAYLYENRGDDAAAALHVSGAALLFQPYRIIRL